MASKTVFYQLDTNKTMSDIKSATQKACMFLGGTIMERGDGFQITQGNKGVNFSFAAEFDALVSIRESKPGKYDFLVNINWKPNALFWACLIIGFFIFGILWIVPLLYLFIDPFSAYQQALFSIPNFL